MSEEIKTKASELSDTELDSVTGGGSGFYPNGRSGGLATCDKYKDVNAFTHYYYDYWNNNCPFLKEQHHGKGCYRCSDCKYFHH